MSDSAKVPERAFVESMRLETARVLAEVIETTPANTVFSASTG